MSKIHQEVVFEASLKRIYEALTDGKQFSAFSGGAPADISAEAGGSFSCFEGWFSGEISSWYPTNGSPRHGAPNLGKVASSRSPSSSYRRRAPGLESSLIIRVSRLNNRSALRAGGKQTIGSRYENIWPRSG